LLFRRNPKNRVRQVHWIFQNPPRKPQSHQILAVLEKILFNQILAVLGRIFYVIAKHRIAVLWQSPGREPYYKLTQDIFVLAGKRRTQAKE
jgi:hypothetical protein